MKWYYVDIASDVMFCSNCYEDDQFCMITYTQHVAKMPQVVRCAGCGWKPKEDGLHPPKKALMIKRNIV